MDIIPSSNSQSYIKTPLRISTMVVTANWGAKIDRDILFKYLMEYMIPIWYPDEGILKIEHKKNVYGASHKELFTNRKVTSKAIFNQSTIVVRRKIPDGWKEVNIKLFVNGAIQMTGVKSTEFAVETIDWLLNIIRTFPISPFDGEIHINKVQTSLINTDFSINKDIQQDALQKILVEEYNLISTLEKTIYQGINMKYFYNTNNIGHGVCNCTGILCKGYGRGDGNGNCKRITVSIFRTGKIIITGAMTMDQINAAYVYIAEILEKHSSKVLLSRV